jgi:hypothetical protein
MNPNPLEPEAASGDTSACLRWLHVNLVLSRSVSLSEEQLRQLSHAVGDDAVRLPIALEPPRPLTRSVVRPALMTDAGAHGDGRGCDDGPRRRRDVVRGTLRLDRGSSPRPWCASTAASRGRARCHTYVR